MIPVSIIIPVYNKEQTLRETLESILQQDQDEYEIIVVDDGSTDGSKKVIDSFTDRRIRSFSICNSGPSSARNYGIQKSCGKWILILDADDILFPHSLKALLTAANTWPQADMIVGNYVTEESDSRKLAYTKCKEGPLSFPFKEWFFRKLIPCAGTYICKREIMLLHPYKEYLRRSEDVEQLFRIFRNTRIARILMPVMKYRRDYSSASKTLPPIENEFMGNLSFDRRKSLWEKICLYEYYICAKSLYPEASARLYGYLRKRYLLILAYHLAFRCRAFFD